MLDTLDRNSIDLTDLLDVLIMLILVLYLTAGLTFCLGSLALMDGLVREGSWLARVEADVQQEENEEHREQ